MFLNAFGKEVNRGDVHAFYRQYTKYQTIDKRRLALEAANRDARRLGKGCPYERSGASKRSPCAWCRPTSRIVMLTSDRTTNGRLINTRRSTYRTRRCAG